MYLGLSLGKEVFIVISLFNKCSIFLFIPNREFQYERGMHIFERRIVFIFNSEKWNSYQFETVPVRQPEKRDMLDRIEHLRVEVRFEEIRKLR